jgi:hypothetical protein
MSVGKYSPTVSRWYAKDQNWWAKNGGGRGNGINPECYDDDEGFDSYGYSENGEGPDRAGNTESEYLCGGEWDEDDYRHPLYDSVSDEWWMGKQKYKNQL